MDSIAIISKYYPPNGLSFNILINHSQAVSKKAVEIGKKLNLGEADLSFIGEAALLHDIGIFYTSAPEIGCFGDLPYICHGFRGYNLLWAEGLPKHALVCERHTGTGLTLYDIDSLNGLLPRRPMEPISLTEKIIAYCDKFFSKDPVHYGVERSFDSIVKDLRRFGEEKVKIFEQWHRQFSI